MKSHPKIIDRILEKIRESRTICVVGHLRPDGDCIGSQLAMALALRRQGKEVVCWDEDPLPPKYVFLDPGHLVQKPNGGPEFDLVIALDCASFERLGTIGPAAEHRHWHRYRKDVGRLPVATELRAEGLGYRPVSPFSLLTLHEASPMPTVGGGHREQVTEVCP